MHSLFALLFVLFAFDVGQTKAIAFNNRNDLRKIDVDRYHGSDYEDPDGPEVPRYNTAAAESDDDGLNDVELGMDKQWRRNKRWVPTEVNYDVVRQKLLLSKLVGSTDRQDKRQSRSSFQPSPDGYDDVTTNEKLFRPIVHPRHLKDGGRHFSGEEKLRHHQPNRIVDYGSEADEGNSESLSIVDHPGRVEKVTSMTGKMPFASKNNGNISKWKKVLKRPGEQQRQLRDAIFVLSDYLDRQKTREISRQLQSLKQKNRQEEEEEERQGQRVKRSKGQRDDQQAHAETVTVWSDTLNGVKDSLT